MFLLSAAQPNQHVDDNYHPLNVWDDNYMEIVFKYLSCEGQPCIKMTKTKRRIMATHTPSQQCGWPGPYYNFEAIWSRKLPLA